VSRRKKSLVVGPLYISFRFNFINHDDPDDNGDNNNDYGVSNDDENGVDNSYD